MPLLSSKLFPRLEIFLAKLIAVGLATPVQRCPLRLVLEQAHCLRVLQAIVSICSTWLGAYITFHLFGSRLVLTFLSVVVNR